MLPWHHQMRVKNLNMLIVIYALSSLPSNWEPLCVARTIFCSLMYQRWRVWSLHLTLNEAFRIRSPVASMLFPFRWTCVIRSVGGYWVQCWGRTETPKRSALPPQPSSRYYDVVLLSRGEFMTEASAKRGVRKSGREQQPLIVYFAQNNIWTSRDRIVQLKHRNKL